MATGFGMAKYIVVTTVQNLCEILETMYRVVNKNLSTKNLE